MLVKSKPNEVIKRFPKPCFTIPLIRENRFIKHRVPYSARNFAKTSFFVVIRFRNVRWPMVRNTESNGLNLFLRVREIVEKGLRHLFITSNRSYFFNKIDFKQYLFKNLFSSSLFSSYGHISRRCFSFGYKHCRQEKSTMHS